MISLLKSLIFGVFVVDMLERRFPQQFRTFATELSFNSLYLFSKMQIFVTKLNKIFNEFVQSNPILSKIKNKLDEVIKLTNINPIVPPTEFIKNGEALCLEDKLNCDFQIFSWLSNDNKCINRKIIYDINEPLATSEYSDLKFILVEIKIKDKSYKVDLKTDEYNYYLVGNKFTKQFFVYFLKKYLNLNENICETDEFILNIIDHTVTCRSIIFTDKNETILLEKNIYKLLDTNQNDG